MANEEVLMRGHLQHRGGDAWRIKVYLGRSADGRKRYLERTVRGTRRDAERGMARLAVEVDEGRHAGAAPMTFGELLDRWLEVKRASVAPRTIEILAIGAELEEALGVKVDVGTPDSLEERLRDEVLAEGVTL
ncbi:hypothetical protein HC251_24210 [Iamia sp. SCSIO 61187]|uniref:hypothetical protein n=1 Tax=Iamia sp. SCSIO 61187 TaxID=2722752 RepID=UPI001C624B5C|nr:hypothetical protein [Iamia sp. SCSIO 61187]QYG95227.1 hypothetical protein HC251_24210 [Iamia sp. SCSIO 61187]